MSGEDDVRLGSPSLERAGLWPSRVTWPGCPDRAARAACTTGSRCGSYRGGDVSGPAPTVYVSNGCGGTVMAIDTATNTPGPPIPVGPGPGLIAITPDGKTAYVTSNDPVVVPIATATSTPGPPIRVGLTRPGRRITPSQSRSPRTGKTAYVASINSGTVDADRHGDEHAGRADRGRCAARAIVITPDGKTADVVNQSRPQPPPVPWTKRRTEDRRSRARCSRHGHADRHGHEHGGRADRCRERAAGDRDHAGRQDGRCRRHLRHATAARAP